MQRAKLVPVVLLLLAAFGFLFFSVRSSTVADAGDAGLKLLPADQTQPAPDWTLPDAASGRPVSLSQEARRRPVVFSFWATWCGPCREELPHIERIAQKYRGRVAVYGVNSSDAPPAIGAFARENRLSFPMLSDLKRDAATRYGAESIPMLVVVDTHDRVRAVSVGYDPGGDLEAALSNILDTLLSQNRPDAEERPMKLTALPAALLLTAGAASAAPLDTTATPLATLEKAITVQVKETVLLTSSSSVLQPAMTLNVTLSRPGHLRIEYVPAGAKGPNSVLTSEGKTLTEYNPVSKRYRNRNGSTGIGPEGLPMLGDYSAPAVATTATLDGRPALLYNGPPLLVQGQTLTQKLWVDPTTHLPERQSTMMGEGETAKEVQRVVFSDWSLGKTLSPALFVFTPPAGATEVKSPSDAPLLAKGTSAPDFTAIDKDGKSVKLSDFQGKVVVIDFWASWCPPCRASMPHNQEVAKKFQDAGVPFVLLAVDNSEERGPFLTWVAKNGPDLSALTFVHIPRATKVAGKLYHVTGIPTQYVIDPKGNITASFVGYGGPTDDLANAVKAAGAS